MLVAAFMRFYQLQSPDEMMFDETHYVPSAQIIAGVKPHPGMGAWSSDRLISRSPEPNFSHPPLAKIIIAAGIVVFGDHPLGWRLFEALAGTIVVLLLVIIGVELGISLNGSLLAGWLLATDGLHIVITRLAMLDAYLFLFSAMALHGVLLFRRQQQAVYLIYAAIASGAALACKESALNVVFAMMIVMCLPVSAAGLTNKNFDWRRRGVFALTLGMGALVAYGLSGFYYVANGFSPIEWVQFRAHVITKLVNPLSEHRYGSGPLSWLIAQKPVWIYWKDLGSAVRGIVATGNFLFWWAFIPAALFTLWQILKSKGRVIINHSSPQSLGLLLFVGLTLPIAVMVARRVGFLYHHLPAVTAMAIVVAATIDQVSERKRGLLQTALVVATGLQMVAFSPVLIGLPMSRGWYDFIRFFTGV